MPRSILVADRWLWFALEAGLSALLALAALAAPGAGLHFLAAAAGVLAIASGGLALTLAAPGHTLEPRWTAFAVEGIAGVAAGVAILALGARGPGWLAICLGLWATLTGAAQLGAGLRLHRQIQGEWLLGLAGGLSVAAGLVLLGRARDGALALAPLLGLYAAALAATYLLVALRLRAWARGRERAASWVGTEARA